MDISKRTIEFMNKYAVTAQKRFSQNFLVNQKAVDTILASVPFDKVDEVIEIGPGLGALTFDLVKKAQHLTAVEFDRDMVKVLSNEIKDSNFTLIQNDFLKQDLSMFHVKQCAYIGNLPYQITRDLIKKILTDGHFSYFGFMIQKDLSDELFYQANSSSNNSYAAFIALVGKLEKVADLAPANFYPSPKVDSSFLKLTPTDRKYANLQTFKILEAMFRNPKKTLMNNMKNSIYPLDEALLNKLGLEVSVRPHQLNIMQLKQFIDHYLVLSNNK